MKTSLITVLLSLVLLETTAAITVTNIWQSLKITNPSTSSRPQDIRTATVGWKIVTADVLHNDIFFFLMPYVFRTKFSGNEILLKADGTIYARCQVNDGSFNRDASYLKCSMTSSVDDKKDTTAVGEITFDFVFNAGGSSSDSDISSAKRFTSGDNQVSFNNIQSDVNFQSGPFFTDKKTDELLYYSRSTPQDLEQVFVLSGTCNEGITSGSMVFTTNNSVDCSQFKLKITNDLNDFYLPKSYKSIDVGSIRCSSDNKKLTATFNNIPLGYRVFLEGFEKYPDNSIYVKHLYAENIKCSDGSSKVDGITKIIRVVDGVSSSNGDTEVSSSIALSSSLEMTSTHETSSPCNECSTTPITETETTLNTNTVTETICSECAHKTSESATREPSSSESTSESTNREPSSSESTTREHSTSESTSESTKTSSEVVSSISKSSETSSKLESSTTESETSSETPCESCSHSSILSTSIPPPVSHTTESYTEPLSGVEETTLCTECTLSSTIQTQTETTTSINRTTETISCYDCSISLISSTSVPPVVETTEMSVNNTTETHSCQDCVSSSILSTSIPPAIGTTETTLYEESSVPSEYVDSQTSEFVLSTIDIANGTTTYAEPLETGECLLCEYPPITDAETITESISCDEDCTTTFPTYVPELSSESLQKEHSDILPTSSTVDSSINTNSQPQSDIADTSISSHAIITGTAALPPSYSAEYPSSTQYIPPYAFSSYEALSNSNRCSWSVLLFSILALLV
jgi:hypothetical protein